MMDNFLDTCSKHDNVNFRDFGVYFSKYYANRIHLWALCFRGLCPPTNMTIESYHRLLKRHGGIMDSKTNVRMDTLLFHIETHLSMQATRIMKNRALNSVSNINTTANFQAHMEAAAINLDQVELFVDSPTDTQTATVQSFNDPAKQYTVSTRPYECPFKPCLQACKKCSVCWHTHICSCPEAVNKKYRLYSCKHAHLVCIKLAGTCYEERPVASTSATAPTAVAVEIDIGTITAAGRSNTPLACQKRRGGIKTKGNKMYRTSKTKEKRNKSTPYISLNKMYEREQCLLRVTSPSDTEDQTLEDMPDI